MPLHHPGGNDCTRDWTWIVRRGRNGLFHKLVICYCSRVSEVGEVGGVNILLESRSVLCKYVVDIIEASDTYATLGD